MKEVRLDPGRHFPVPYQQLLFLFVLLLVLVHDISKRKKVTSTECLSVDVRLEVSVEVKPVSYDVT